MTLMDRGGVVAAVFLDLKKPFDMVNHKVLVSKLSAFNFSPDTLNWIQSYLGMRQQQCEHLCDVQLLYINPLSSL